MAEEPESVEEIIQAQRGFLFGEGCPRPMTVDDLIQAEGRRIADELREDQARRNEKRLFDVIQTELMSGLNSPAALAWNIRAAILQAFPKIDLGPTDG